MINPGDVPDDILEEWVKPFYMNVLHGNYAYASSDREFVSHAKKALKNISPAVIDSLFADINWRGRITAAWFCGLKGWRQYEDIIGESLLESRVCYAGIGYCFAFAHFADEKSSDYLVRYLEKYLAQVDKYYDQGCAMAALMWIDEKRKTNLSSSFIKPEGPWDKFVSEKIKVSDAWTLEHRKESFYKVMKTSIEVFN